MGIVGGGAQAELVVIHERHAMPVPDGLGWAEAAAFPEVFMTAYDSLVSRCCLSMGDRVCVHGAAGGVGLAAVQLAVAAGASVVATVRSPGLRDAVAEFGAEVVGPDEFVDRGPFDVILEAVGGPNIPSDIDALATEGRVAIISFAAGAEAAPHLGALMATRGHLVASVLRNRSLEEKALVARRVEKHVLPLLVSGRLKVVLAGTYAMRDAATAYQRFAAGGKLGKTVLQLEP